ncbi:hypothetical protein RB594_008713 [Gaeumannomyces avenae]
MSDAKEQAPHGVADEPPVDNAAKPVPAEPTAAPVAASGAGFERPGGWMYKRWKVAGRKFNIWYASPKAQLLVVSMVCFLCPGMFNALTGLGDGGLSDNASVQAKANTALYSTFAVVGFFSGTFANRLGIKATTALGGLGYCIYAASLLTYKHTQNGGFCIFAGAFLGVCAGLLWCAQGAIMMSYPPESQKGRYISWFWVIFNLGAVVGAFIPLGQNVNNITGPATDGTYIGFIVLMVLGATLALFLCNSTDVVREDGSKVIVMKNPSWQSEIWGLWEVLIEAPWIVALFPMFFSSNIFYAYQLNNMNGALFNTRTRSLNNLLYWLGQIFGAIFMGYALDFPGVRRSMRAKISFGVLFALTFIIWGGGWAFQSKQPTRAFVKAKDSPYVHIDWTDGGEHYIGPAFLLIFYAVYDAVFQTSIYWYMGALSNSGRKTANMAGFYKGIQSAGAAVFWSLDGVNQLEFNTIFGATWGLLAASILIAAPIIFLKIKDTVPVEEDLKNTDENIEDVVAPGAVAEKKVDV